MKRTMAGWLGVALLALATVPASAQIASSAHDFSTASWTSDSEICSVCHTPHGTAIAADLAPLWGHELADTANVTYTMYTGFDLDGTVSAKPDGTTVLCLGCHDGQGNLDAFGGAAGTVTMATATDGYTVGDLGADLGNDHPVSIVYDVTDTELYATSTASGLGGTIAQDLLDVDGKVQCASCHDVHNGAGIAKLLVKTNSGDALCTTCHNK